MNISLILTNKVLQNGLTFQRADYQERAYFSVFTVRMYWTNYCQPKVRVKQNIFEQTLIKVVSFRHVPFIAKGAGFLLQCTMSWTFYTLQKMAGIFNQSGCKMCQKKHYFMGFKFGNVLFWKKDLTYEGHGSQKLVLHGKNKMIFMPESEARGIKESIF